MTDTLVVLLHLCDSLFPLGSFAHCDGLEAATTGGAIRSAADLRAWMDTTLRYTLRLVEARAVAQAWQSAREQRFDALTTIDDEVYALRPTSTGREATRAMGTRLLKTWQQIRPRQSENLVSLPRLQLTLPVAFGVVAASADIPVRAAIEGFIYTRLAGTVSAAMRLMPIGQHEGHALLANLLEGVPLVTDDILGETVPLGAFTPVLDVTMMSHQYVESRLFKS